jgi:hypothetical protein
MYEQAKEKLTELAERGFCKGAGSPDGQLCIESAIKLALGEPHGDNPSCVAEPDRAYAIAINDAEWSSTQARAKALLPLGLAQLGTAGKDRSVWVQKLAMRTVREVLPIALRLVTGLDPTLIAACEQALDLPAAAAAARAAGSAAYAAAAAHAAADAAAHAACSADAADAAADAAAYAAGADAAAHAACSADAAAYAAARAATAAAAHAAACSADAAAAAAYAADGSAKRDEILSLSVVIALECYADE